MNNLTNDHPNNIENFWGELAPVKQSIQLYASDEVFLKKLEAFVSGGLWAGDTVIVITTLAHRNALEKRLKARGVDIAAAKERDQYIPLDARTTLADFMANDFPDEDRFNRFVSDLLTRAHQQGPQVRAFSEMVSMLWTYGYHDATIRLEQLWHKFCDEKAFCIFCAYPRSGFTQEVSVSLAEICAEHSRVFAEQSLPFLSYQAEVAANPPVIEPIKIWGDRLVN